MHGGNNRGSRDGDYFPAMADILSGLLFIFIIIAMVFAINVRESVESALERQTVAERTYAQTVKRIMSARLKLLQTLQQRLSDAHIPATIVPDDGILRLPAAAFFGDKGQDLQARADAAKILADALADTLGCVADGGNPALPGCADFAPLRLQTAHLDIHDDGHPGTPLPVDRLSQVQAAGLLASLAQDHPPLLLLSRPDGRALLDVRGQGNRWPLAKPGAAPGDKNSAGDLNNRLDLRIEPVLPPAPDEDSVTEQPSR